MGMGGSCQFHRLLSHSIRKAWSTINKLTGRYGLSSLLCPDSENSIISQLVKNGAHRTRGHEFTRLINMELPDLWKVSTPEGHSISELFRPEELAAALRRLRPEKSPGLDSIFQKLILDAGSGLKFWFCVSLTSCTRQLKTPNICRRALTFAITKPRKATGGPN